MTRVGGGDVYTGVWRGNLMEKDTLEDLGVDGVYLNGSSRNRMGSCTGLSCLRMCRSGGLM